MSQYALPLDSRSPGDPARIIIGNANRAAADALSDPSDWPFHTAVLIGPPRSGKSLLAKWFLQAGKGDAIEAADTMDETVLFHRWNLAQQDGRPLLLVTQNQAWAITLPDLRSRIGGSLQLEIGTPDDEMIAGLIEAHAEQRRLVLADGASAYLVPRVERSFLAVERLVAAMDRISLERQVPATMSVWRDALESVQGAQQARLL